MICDNFQIIRCFDFLNHIDNMRPFAEVALSRRDVVFEPAISMSWANGFDVAHYLGVAENVLSVCGDVAGMSEKEVSRHIILASRTWPAYARPAS